MELPAVLNLIVIDYCNPLEEPDILEYISVRINIDEWKKRYVDLLIRKNYTTLCKIQDFNDVVKCSVKCSKV